jgi:hypothetical protein
LYYDIYDTPAAGVGLSIAVSVQFVATENLYRLPRDFAFESELSSPWSPSDQCGREFNQWFTIAAPTIDPSEGLNAAALAFALLLALRDGEARFQDAEMLPLVTRLGDAGLEQVASYTVEDVSWVKLSDCNNAGAQCQVAEVGFRTASKNSAVRLALSLPTEDRGWRVQQAEINSAWSIVR